MKRIIKILLSLPFILVAAALGLYALGGFLVVPWYIKRELPEYFKNELRATATVGEIKVNPFLLTLEMRDFAVTESGGKTPAIGLNRLFVDFELSSLFRRAWTFAEVVLDEPRINLEVDANETLNLAKLSPAPKPEAKPHQPSGLPRLLLQRFELNRGAVAFTDRGINPPATARLTPVELDLHDISTLPDQHGEYTLAARLPAGGSLAWRGTLSLAPIASDGQIDVKDLKLATLWQFLKDRLSIEEPTGSATLSLRYRARYAENKLDAGADNMALHIKDVAMRQRGQSEPMLTAGEISLTGGAFDFAKRSLLFKEFALRRIGAYAVIDEDGTLNWQQLMADRKTTQKPQPAAAATGSVGDKPPPAPWKIAIESVHAAEIRLRALHEGMTRPLTVDIGQAELKAGLDASVGAESSAVVDNISIDLADIRVQESNAKDNLLALGNLNLGGGKFDLAQNRFSAATLKLSKASAQIVRDADGSINLLKAFTPKKVKPPEPSKFTAEIQAVELIDGNLSLTDRSLEPALALDLQNLRVLAKNVTTAGKTAIPLEASLQIRQGGAIRAQGSVSPEQQRAALRLDAKGIALAPLAAMVSRHTTLKLASGSAHASGQLDWSGAGKTPGVRYAGRAGIDGFQLNEEAGGERFAGWKSLLAEGIRVDTANRSARIDDVRLNTPNGKIVIAKDRSTNFSRIMRKSGAQVPAAAEPQKSAPAAASAAAPPTPQNSAEKPFVASVERVHVEQGELDFSDLALVLPFSALIREFNGNITGLSSQSGTRAGVKLEGRVDEFGQAQVSGTINPFEPKAHTDLSVIFRNVAMSPLSPYSATFAGRRIASGKLSLDLQYKLNNSQLAGENKVLLEQFTLGERVESPGAVNLPLDLAIALLTDSSGKIDISVPVRGNVDNPEFAYSHLVWQAIRTVIVNIVTAPFRALASLFGGNADKLDAIGFEAGRAQLAPPEREKLNRVAGVLKQRPQLRLLVQGRYDVRHDGAALRARAARSSLAERLGIKLASTEDLAPPNFDNAKTQREIEAMLEARAGGDAANKFKAEHEKKTGKEVKRVNAALALVGRGSPDRDFYDAMFNRVSELQPLDDAALTALATQRATAITEFLKSSAALDAARVGTAQAGKVEADKPAEIATALSLEPTKK